MLKPFSKLLFLGISTLITVGMTTGAWSQNTTNISITINPQSKFCAIPGSAGGSYTSSSQVPLTTQTIGDLGICTNRSQFVIKVSSVNGGQLKTVPSSGDLFTYQIQADLPSDLGNYSSRK
jgi:hypothetical protein